MGGRAGVTGPRPSPQGTPSPEHPGGSGGAAQTQQPQPGQGHLLRGRLSLRTASGESSPQGLTSEPRMGLGPCSLSLGELHPDAGVLLLLGEESEGWGEREAQSEARQKPVARRAASAPCFPPSRAGGRQATTSLWTLFFKAPFLGRRSQFHQQSRGCLSAPTHSLASV